jgi:hypothetical protein
LPDEQITSPNQKSCQARLAKTFLFRFSELHDYPLPSRLRRRGVSRSSRTLEAGCGGREEAQRALSAPTKAFLADGQAVWSCPPDAGVKPCEMIARRWWLTSPVHQGERGAAVKTIAQGMPDCLGCPVVACVRKVHLLCTQGSRVRPASGIPCALFTSRAKHEASLGHERAAGMRSHGLSSSLRGAKRRRNPRFGKR